ncbi:MAG: rod shape-determining protein MreC [Bacilli bacterium]|nr:rod shape-determining protein MreC [Bacilli bacterium]
MKVKTFVIFILIYLIAFIGIKTNINIFYPYYLLKDLVFFPIKNVQANSNDIKLDYDVQEGINNELKSEFEELKKLNDLSSTMVDFSKVSALVIERNKMYWFNTITINKGASSGIKEDMAVIDCCGLIGRINKVSKTTSEVKLITTNDTNHKISVMIETNGEKIYGILSGYDNNTNKLQITSVNKAIEIEENSKVYTSGMGGIFPSGILIGKVAGTKQDKYDVSKVIEVTPSANINDTKFVNVLERHE